jgi:hypothetical protein
MRLQLKLVRPIAHHCTCSKSAAKIRLPVEVPTGLMPMPAATPSSLRNHARRKGQFFGE